MWVYECSPGRFPREYLLALCLLLACRERPASAQGIDSVIAHAEVSAQAGGPSAMVDLAALFDVLGASHDPIRRIQLSDAVGCLGDTAGKSSAAAKAAVLAHGPGLLLGIVRSADADWPVRGDAMVCLRTINAPNDVAGQAIAAAPADAGEHAGYLHSQTIASRAWSGNGANSAAVLASNDADANRQAPVFLRQHGIDISYDALGVAVGNGQPGVVAGLLVAGLNVSGTDARRATVAVVSGLASACNQNPVPTEGVAESLSVLVDHGLPPNLSDESGNTMLMSAAQLCPVAVTARLLALGAAVDPVNNQRFTPLQMALVSGKWDVAKVLIDHGARITRTQADQIFFEPPQEQAQRDLLARATR
jgi:hypothetical protein